VIAIGRIRASVLKLWREGFANVFRTYGRGEGEQRFMDLAGVFNGPPDLSSRRGFSRSTSPDPGSVDSGESHSGK